MEGQSYCDYYYLLTWVFYIFDSFPGGSVVKSLPAMKETRVQSLGLDDPLEKVNGNPLQCSCLGNPMDRGAWWATVHGVSHSQTWLSDQQEISIMNRIYLHSFKESKGTESFFFFFDLQHRIHGQWLNFFFQFIFYFLAAPHGMWDINFLFRNWTQALCIGSMERHWTTREIPNFIF